MAEWDKPRQVRIADPLWEEAGRACRKLRTDRAKVMREALEAVVAQAERADEMVELVACTHHRGTPHAHCSRCGCAVFAEDEGHTCPPAFLAVPR